MSHSARRTALAATTIALLIAAPETARADGLPAMGVDAAPVTSPGAGGHEYLTRRVRRDTLLVERLAGSKTPVRRLRLRGRFAVPAVAYDGTPSGLSADGRTLVLIQPRRAFPRAQTTLALVDARRMRLRRTVHLPGDFSFDAIAPLGRTMYLVEYLSRRDFTRYAVRAYDLRTRRLLPETIVDPREPDERMGGVPITRATSADGRWEYTLYDSAEHPFIHALDTERRRAFCIDLDSLADRPGGAWRLTLGFDGPRTLVLSARSGPLASVDTRTLRVRRAATTTARPRPVGRGGPGWALVAGPTLLLLAGSALAFWRPRGRNAAATRTAAP